MPGTLALLGWDLRPRWQVRVPIPGKVEILRAGVPDEGQATLALSPDGHVVALAHRQGKLVRVWSWRDGCAQGEAHFTWPDNAATTSPAVRVTDGGRVWLSTNIRTHNFDIDLRCWAVDGQRTAAGCYTPSSPNFNDLVHAEFSPDGTALITSSGAETSSAIVDYAAVRVIGSQVVISHIYTDTSVGQTFIWCDNQTAIDTSGKHFGAGREIDGENVAPPATEQRPNIGDMIDRQGKHAYVFPLPPRLPWAVPAQAQQYCSSMRCFANGTALLVHETRSLYRDPLPDRQRHASWLRNLFAVHHESEQLAIYQAPGTLCAVLPLPYLVAHGVDYSADPHRIALASDGHRLAIVGNSKEGKQQELLVYGW